jgi:hypothetical protein
VDDMPESIGCMGLLLVVILVTGAVFFRWGRQDERRTALACASWLAQGDTTGALEWDDACRAYLPRPR